MKIWVPCVSPGSISFPSCPHGKSPLGLPEFLTLLFLHATACGLRRTLIPSPFLVFFVLFSVYVKPLGVRTTHFEAVPALQGARHPYSLQDTLSTLCPPCSPPFGNSATDARLDMAWWLALTRRGLSPRKKRRAYLGAITGKLSRARSASVTLLADRAAAALLRQGEVRWAIVGADRVARHGNVASAV